MIKAIKTVMAEAADYCVSKLPLEACGVLMGTVNSHVITITGYAGIDNVASQPATSFEMNPSQWVSLLFANDSDGVQIVGIFHSHPTVSTEPSQQDLQTLWTHIPSHWIFSLTQPANPILAAYQFDPAGGYRQLAYELT